MKLRLTAAPAALAFALLCATAANAGGANPTGAAGSPNPNAVTVQGVAGGTAITTSDQAFLGEVALTVGVADSAARRSLKAICTVAGDVSVTYSDTSTGVWPAVVGTQTFPISVTTVNSSGTTATCTYKNLK